jgi:DNA-directed RNA polymerase
VQYDDRIGANFVRDWQPGTKHKERITEVFKNGLIAPHAQGVNALQRVPFLIDWDIAKLVEKRGAELMGHTEKQYLRDKTTVDDDMRTARWIGEQPFYLTYNCDTRGRVYAIPHFNYGREDHVRAMFKFANGLPLGGDGTRWLEINCANCGGFKGIDKRPWDERVEWAKHEKKMIQRVARDPDCTIDIWREADRKFAFVAACRELTAAWEDPDHFKTHLPIEFDGSANGIQHLALLARDPDAARRVNLIWSDSPRDVYQEIINHVRESLEADGRKSAQWWAKKFKILDNRPGKIRKLIKTPAMTFAYNATPHGMAENIAEVYREEFEGLEPKEDVGRFLAKQIIEACREILSKPARVMEYICELSDHCSDAGRALDWISPTGFPVRNDYRAAKKRRINLLRANGKRLRHTILDGVTKKIRKRAARNASAPNYVHSQDASHLVRVINAAVAEGITSIAPVHDAFACLAPQAREFTGAIRTELAEMYIGVPGKELRLLRGYNRNHVDNLPMPPDPGTLDPREVWAAWWSFD